MKLNEDTLSVLKNFATINSNIVLKGGTKLDTISETKTVIGEAILDSEFPSDIGIYDLSEFLATLSLMSNPEVDFQKKYMTIKDSVGRSRIKYYYSDPELLTSPAKSINMPEIDVQFDLDWETLEKLKRAAITLGHEELSIVPAADNLLQLSVTEHENKTSNVFSIDIPGKFSSESTFNLILNINNLKLIQGDYEFGISKKLISHLKHKTQNVQYWIALERNSTYEE